MKKILSILLPVILFLTACSALPTSPNDPVIGSFGQTNNDLISFIDIITVTNAAANTSPDSEIYFDICYRESGTDTLVSLMGDSKRINGFDDIGKGRTNRFSFKPQSDNVRIGQLEKFSLKNTGSDGWQYNCIVVIVNKKRVLFSVDGIDGWLNKGSSYVVDRNFSGNEHLKIDTIHNPSAIRAAITTPQNISVITTTANMISADTGADIYIKFIADSSLPNLVLPDYTCEPTANEYRLDTPGDDLRDGRSDYFSLHPKLVPASFTKTQLTYRANSDGDTDDWCFSTILVLAGGAVVYYKDFASEPITINNTIKNYRCLGATGGKIWIDKYPEPPGITNGFTIAILPDTQGYTVRGSQGMYHTNNSDLGFYRQIEWIVDNMYSRNIKYVVHMGDLIEGYESDLLKWDFDAYAEQWRCARGAMDVLSEVGIPFGFLPGNHDEDSSINPFQDSYKNYFPIENYSNKPGFAGNLDGMTSNAWEISVGNKRYLFINVEDLESPVSIFNTRDRSNIQNWMKGILPDYRGEDDRVILSTHSFAKIDGSFYNNARDLLEGVLTDTRNGLQVDNGNRIDLVLCGHLDGVVYVPGEETTLASGVTIDYPPVILSNFQGEYENSFKKTTYGNGWMRTFTIFNNDAEILTFSVLNYSSHTMGNDRIKSGFVPENGKSTIHNYENFNFFFP